MFAGATRLETLFGGHNVPAGVKGRQTVFTKHVGASKVAGVTACKRKVASDKAVLQVKRQKVQHPVTTCATPALTKPISTSTKPILTSSTLKPTSSKPSQAKHGGVTPSPAFRHEAGGVTPSVSCKRKAGGVTLGSCSPSKKKVKLSSNIDTSDMVGAVSESLADHILRHPHPLPECARCQWIKWGSSWQEKQGSHRVDRAGKLERIQWVAERATCRGGAWALGCTVCAHAKQRLQTESSLQARQRHGRLDSKWCRFEVRNKCMQAHTLDQHSMNEAHKMAMDIYLCPETPVSELLAESRPVQDDELFKGSVPQPADWLRAWRHLKEAMSFRSCEKISGTENFVQTGVAKGSDRRTVKALQAIIVEGKREQKRQWLRAASSIAILVDDRGAWKVLRFRCDHGGGYKEGLLRVLYRGGDGVIEVERWDDDFCKRESESIIQCLRDFCTSAVSGFDEGLFDHLRSAVHIYVSDGCPAALKTGRMLKTSLLSGIAFMIRDPAHAIRIAARDPLHAEERFGEFWRRVFDSKHALVRDIECSDQIRAKFESCQERVLKIMGSQGGGLKSVLKHLSAAKQRFESFASPARRYCLLLNSLALLLALIATDQRKEKATREAAEEALEAMTPDSIVVAGLTADYTAECLDFVRQFDRSNVDPATLARQRDAFKERMNALFLQGFAALEPAENATDRTMLQIAMAQVDDEPVFHYNDKKHVLWCSGAAAKVKTSVARMANVVSDLLERLDAELGDDDMVCKFQVFDLLDWKRPDLSEARKQRLSKHLTGLTRALGQDGEQAKREFQQVLPAALASRELKVAGLTAAGVTADKQQTVDNRDCWGEILESKETSSMQVLPKVIRLYNAVPLGTPDVERNLGQVTALLHEHAGSNTSETITMLLEGVLELQEKEEELFVSKAGCAQHLLLLTETSREWQQMWIFLHGRRFHGYEKTRSPKEKTLKKGHKLGSEALIQQQRRNAATALVTRALKPDADMNAKCFGGLLRKDLCGCALTNVMKQIPKTKMQVKFQQRTKQICENRQKEVQLRRGGRGLKWCLAPKLRVGSSAAAQVPDRPARVQVVPMRTSAAFRIEPSASVSVRPSLYSSVRVAHVIVVPDMKPFSKCDTWDAAILLIYAIGLGKIMIGEKDWHGSRPWEGAKAIRYKAQAKASCVTLVASSRLQKHGNVMQALRACSEDGTWSLVTERPADVGARQLVHLDELPSMRAFLLKQRRIYHQRNAHGKFQKK